MVLSAFNIIKNADISATEDSLRSNTHIFERKRIPQNSCARHKNNYHQAIIKRLEVTNFGKNVEIREPFYSVGRNIKWYSHYKKQHGDFSKN